MQQEMFSPAKIILFFDIRKKNRPEERFFLCYVIGVAEVTAALPPSPTQSVHYLAPRPIAYSPSPLALQFFLFCSPKCGFAAFH